MCVRETTFACLSPFLLLSDAGCRSISSNRRLLLASLSRTRSFTTYKRGRRRRREISTLGNFFPGASRVRVCRILTVSTTRQTDILFLSLSLGKDGKKETWYKKGKARLCARYLTQRRPSHAAREDDDVSSTVHSQQSEINSGPSHSKDDQMERGLDALAPSLNCCK